MFGGVAIGSIKAIDADNVAVNMSSNGFKCIAIETEARIGKIICVVAVFEVSSVKKLTNAAVMIMIKMG